MSKKPQALHCEDAKPQFKFLLLAVLIGLLVRLVAMASDQLNWDIYYMMNGTEKPFFEYTRDASMGPTLLAYWWVVGRTIGEGLLAHRLMPLALNIASLLIVASISYRAQRLSPYAAAFTTLFFGINAWAVYTVEYPVINYSVEVLLGAVSFTIFLDVASQIRGEASRSVTTRATLMLILSPLASYTIIVPVCAGFTSVIVWQAVSRLTKKSESVPLAKLFPLSPVLAVPIVQLTLWLAIPFQLLGDRLQPHMFPYFFGRSDYPQNIEGILAFAAHNTRYWAKEVMTPVAAERFFAAVPVPQWLAYGFLILGIVVVLAVAAYRKKLDTATCFALLYLFIAWGAILFGGLVSKYPYGTVRYTGWLLVPVSMVVGSSFGLLISRLQCVAPRCSKRLIVAPAFSLSTVLAALFLGSTISTRQANYAARDILASQQFDRIFYSDFVSPPFGKRLASNASSEASIGFGKFYKAVEDPSLESPAFKRFEADLNEGLVNSIAVAAQTQARFRSLHPIWWQAIINDFELTRETQAPHLWIGEFKRRPVPMVSRAEITIRKLAKMSRLLVVNAIQVQQAIGSFSRTVHSSVFISSLLT